MRTFLCRFLVLAFWLCAFLGAWQARCDRAVVRCADLARQTETDSGAKVPGGGQTVGSRRHAVPAYVQAAAADDAACGSLVLPSVPPAVVFQATPDPVAVRARLWRWSLPPPATPVQLRCVMLI